MTRAHAMNVNEDLVEGKELKNVFIIQAHYNGLQWGIQPILTVLF